MTTAANAATATPPLRAAGQSLHRHVARLPAHPPDLRPGDGIGTLAATGQSGRILTLEPCDVCWGVLSVRHRSSGPGRWTVYGVAGQEMRRRARIFCPNNR